MSKKNYSSGNPTAKSDFYVEFVSKNSGGVKIDIQSKTIVLHFSKLKNSFADRRSSSRAVDLGGLSSKLENIDLSYDAKLPMES